MRSKARKVVAQCTHSHFRSILCRKAIAIESVYQSVCLCLSTAAPLVRKVPGGKRGFTRCGQGRVFSSMSMIGIRCRNSPDGIRTTPRGLFTSHCSAGTTLTKNIF